jgi:hypothetical protein
MANREAYGGLGPVPAGGSGRSESPGISLRLRRHSRRTRSPSCSARQMRVTLARASAVGGLSCSHSVAAVRGRG